jgi:hypothetical protein
VKLEKTYKMVNGNIGLKIFVCAHYLKTATLLRYLKTAKWLRYLKNRHNCCVISKTARRLRYLKNRQLVALSQKPPKKTPDINK